MILLKNIRYLVQDADHVQRDVDLLTEGRRIAAIGPTLACPEGAKIIDCSQAVVHPGFCNAHTHLWQTMLKGRRDDLPLDQWCDRVILPFVQNLKATKEESRRIGYLWTKLGMAEMLHSGVTSFIDMDLEAGGSGLPQACREVGMRGAFAFEAADAWLVSDPAVQLAARRRITDLLDGWHDPDPNALVRIILGPSEPNLCTRDLLEWSVATAREYHANIQMHVAETRRDVLSLEQAQGMSTLAYCRELAMLSPRFSAVHCVHLRPEEIPLVKEYGVTVVYNPKSNMKLGSGIAPIAELMQAGVNVALASDGPASNDLMDLYEEMRAGVMLQKVKGMDPSAMGAREIFRMATMGGANALGTDAGALYEGKLADITVADLSGSHLLNYTGAILPMLVYCVKAADVRTVIVGGRVLLENGRLTTMDEGAVRAELEELGAKYCQFK